MRGPRPGLLSRMPSAWTRIMTRCARFIDAARSQALRRKFVGARNLSLHLGCGDEHLPGWVNIDSSPDARADLHIDVRRLPDYFAPGSVSNVLLVHVLGYLRLWEARKLLRDLHVLIHPGGELVLEQPDLAKCCERVLSLRDVPRDTLGEYLEGVRGIFAFALEQDDAQQPYVPYAFGWTGAHLTYELSVAGFGDISAQPGLMHGYAWRDIRITCRKQSTFGAALHETAEGGS